jgi:predicted nucleic acid-binding protein
MRYLLDTDAAIALIKRREAAVGWLSGRSPGEVSLSSVSKAELY